MRKKPADKKPPKRKKKRMAKAPSMNGNNVLSMMGDRPAMKRNRPGGMG